MNPSLRKSIASHVLLGLGFWVFLTLLFTTAAYLQLIRIDAARPYLGLMEAYFVGLGSSATVAPLVFAATRRQTKKALTAWGHVKFILVAFLLYYGWLFLYSAAVLAPYNDKTIVQFFKDTSLLGWTWDLFLLSAFLSCGYAYGFAEKSRQDKLAAAELNRLLASKESELASEHTKHLRQRLGSHFVLNALSNIIALVRRKDSEKAMEGLYLLSDILRSIAHQNDDTLCTLEQELEFLSKYLSFQTIRYPSLKVGWEVETSARDCMLPWHILQPLVENSFKHGMQPSGSLELSIKASRNEDTLDIRVTNSLVGDADTSRSGEGLTLTKLRLEKHFGEKAAFIRSIEDDSYVARIEIPVRPANEETVA